MLTMNLETSAVHKHRHIKNAKRATSLAWTRFDKGTSIRWEMKVSKQGSAVGPSSDTRGSGQ